MYGSINNKESIEIYSLTKCKYTDNLIVSP